MLSKKKPTGYRGRRRKRGSAAAASPDRSPHNTVVSERVNDSSPLSDASSLVTLDERGPLQWETSRDAIASKTSSRTPNDHSHSHESPNADLTVYLGNALQAQHQEWGSRRDLESEAAVDSPSTLISRDIRLTTTMDLLTAQEDPLQSLLSFFLDNVECHVITPYDNNNWKRMKIEVADLGKSEPAVMSAIMALSALYKSQLYGLPRSKALSFYYISRREYLQLPTDIVTNTDLALVVAFLLCIFALIHYDTVSILKEPSDGYARIPASWIRQGSDRFRSALSRRIIAWLKLLQTAAMRGGGAGLLSEGLCSSLIPDNGKVPNIKPSPGASPDAAQEMYEMLSAPVIHFYLQLQQISGDIAKLTHYHRSRMTGQDQDEVTHEVARIKARLKTLWDTRSTPQRQIPSVMRMHLARSIADPLIALVGVCEAAYYAEFVEMHRLLGDPITERNDDVSEAMCQIRAIVDDPDWNAYDEKRKLGQGFLRPLFLYAIECMDHAETAWAVERLHSINDPICRSEFFAAFAAVLSETQLRKGRRVTSKFFSIWYFGMPPPFL